MTLTFSFTSVLVYGLMLLVAGIAIRFFVGQRRFNRRGYGGTEHFHGYWTAVLATSLEGILMIVPHW